MKKQLDTIPWYHILDIWVLYMTCLMCKSGLTKTSRRTFMEWNLLLMITSEIHLLLYVPYDYLDDFK